MPWGWSSAEARQRTIADLTAKGLWPRVPEFGRVRVIGLYDQPYFEDAQALEVLVHKPAWMVDLHEWHPYEPPGDDEEWQAGRAHFYLSEDGEQLIGSYLHQPPISRYTRMVLLVNVLLVDPEMLTFHRTKRRLPAAKPIPERLLRLISLEQ